MTAPYVTGTVSVTAGSAVVTGNGTGWQTGLVIGGLFGLDSANGNPVPILSIDSDTQLTLAKPWRGTTAANQPYWIIRDTAYGQQTVANAQALATYIQRLDNQSLASIAGLAPAADRLPYFTGANSAALTTLSAFARTLLDDANAAAAYATLGEIPGAQLPNRLRPQNGGVTLVNANDAIEDGFHHVNAATQNIPEGATGSLIVAASFTSEVRQIYIRASSGRTWIRASAGGVFGDWHQVIVDDISAIWRAAPLFRGGATSTDGTVMVTFSSERPWNVVQRKTGASAALSFENATGKLLEFSSEPVYTASNVTITAQDANPQVLVGRSTGLKDFPSFSFIGDPNTGMYSIGPDGLGFAAGGVSAITIHPDGTFRSLPTYNTTSASAANVFIATNGTFARSTSSGRYKTDVEDLWPEYRDVIMEMRPVWYRSLCSIDNPDWSYVGFIAEEVGAIEPRLVHWRTEEIVDEEVDREVMVPVERETVRSIETPITEFVDTGLVDGDGQPILREVQRVETTSETVVEMVEEPRTITETVQRSVSLETPVAEGIMYDRLVVHLIAKVQQQQGQINDLLGRVAALEAPSA